MSCRLNLYGWSLQAFKQVVGSGNAEILEAATKHLSESLQEPQLSPAIAWLRMLILKGQPFRDQLPELKIPEDGSLLAMQLETEGHIFAVNSIKRAIARPEYLDLATDSSTWEIRSVDALMKAVTGIKMNVPREYWGWIYRLNHGTPLFGDDFRTSWSRYVIFEKDELPPMVNFFRSAAEYTRVLPDVYTEEMKRNTPTSLPEPGKRFVTELAGWFEQVHQAGQDLYIIWW